MLQARESDGSDVVNVPLNDTFKHGLFVVMSMIKHSITIAGKILPARN
jgi:myo-inositol-hexaphosphate 3-phosphohydrolase